MFFLRKVSDLELKMLLSELAKKIELKNEVFLNQKKYYNLKNTDLYTFTNSGLNSVVSFCFWKL